MNKQKFLQGSKRLLQDLGLSLLSPFVLGTVGLGRGGNAVNTTVGTSAREGKTGEVIYSQCHGKYREAVSWGNVYNVTNGSTGQAPGTALGTSPPILIYNPIGSGVRLSVMFTAGGYISGTLGAGTIFHCGFSLLGPIAKQTDVAPVIGSGAALTPNNCLIGGPPDNTTIAFALGTLNAAPVALYPFAIINAMLATTATNPSEMSEDVDGRIELDEGAGYCLEAVAAAGTSPLLSFGIIYERIPKT